jgi:dUTP pyrophosphatase
MSPELRPREENTLELRIKKLYPSATLPTRAKPGDSGLDLRAHLPEQRHVTLGPGGRQKIWTGIAIELPEGHEGQVRGRSGLTNRGIIACGGLGTVDNGYRGDVGVTLFNNTDRDFAVFHGDRIAQLVVCPVAYPEVVEVEELSETERGADGFGSTGV